MVSQGRSARWTWVAVALTFAAYVAMMCAVAPHHQPWSDEAGDWLVARNFGYWTMFAKVLRFEAHPGLWYTLLWLPIHWLHLPYALINCYCAGLACCGVLVFLMLSPFPMYLRLVVPFTFYLGYQYAIVAREYTLFPLLVFLIAYVYRTRPESRMAMAMLFGLLANLSFHGVLIGAGFLVAFWLKDRKTCDVAWLPKWKAPLVVLVMLVAVSAFSLWPPQNTTAPRTKALWLYGHLGVPVKFDDIAPMTAPPDPNRPVITVEPFAPSAVATAAAVPAPVAAAEPESHPRLKKVIQVLSYAYAPWVSIALLYQLLFVIFLVRSGNWMFLLPLFLVFLFLSVVYTAPWHYGLMWVLQLGILWMVWDEDVLLLAPRLQNAVALMLFVLCVCQLPWTYKAARNDRDGSYFPGKAMAQAVAALPKGDLVASVGDTMVVLPHFKKNPFFNTDFRGVFYPMPAPSVEYLLAVRPPYVVAYFRDPAVPAFLEAGYTVVTMDCGRSYYPHSLPPEACLALLKVDGAGGRR